MDTFSRLVERIYDCVLDPLQWPRALAAVCEELDLMQSVLGYYEIAGRPLLRVQHGISAEWFQRMPLYAEASADYWGGAERVRSFPMCEIVVHSELQPAMSAPGHRFVDEWLAPQGITDMLGTTLSIDASGLSSLVFCSSRKMVTGFDSGLDLLRMLAPHFRRAITIGRQFEFQAVQAAQFAAALEALPHGTLLLDEQLRVQFANRAALRHMATSDAMRIDAGRLVFSDQRCGQALTRAITLAAADVAGFDQRGLAVPTTLYGNHEGERGAIMHVMPMSLTQAGRYLDQRSRAVVFIAKAAELTTLPIDALVLLYDLTPAEGRVCALISQGVSPAATARELGVAESTVRSHLLKVFAKTGTSRQAELIAHCSLLIALCLSLSMPRRAE